MKASSKSSNPELWPNVPLVLAFRTCEGKLILEIPSFSNGLLVTAVGYAIHHEMRAAGEWAAHLDDPRQKGLAAPRNCARRRAENASRLLAVYAALRGLISHPHESILAPDAMRDAATRSYHSALRETRANHSSERKALAA